MENTLTRSSPCAECGAALLWTQNAWNDGETSLAAYRCDNGHVLDPTTTRQCPGCGIHDTVLVSDVAGRQQFRCSRCGAAFQFPR